MDEIGSYLSSCFASAALVSFSLFGEAEKFLKDDLILLYDKFN